MDTALVPPNGTNVGTVGAPTNLAVRCGPAQALVLWFTNRGGGIGVRLSLSNGKPLDECPVLWLTRSPTRLYLPSNVVDADVRAADVDAAEQVSFNIENIETNHP